jgi:hypothetical protein
MECASPIISTFVMRGNDAMPDDVRQRFLPYLHRIAGSRSAMHEEARLRVLVLGALRLFAPRALDNSGLHDKANRLRELSDDVTWKMAKEAATEAARGSDAGVSRRMKTAAAAAAEANTAAAWAGQAAGWAAGTAVEVSAAAADAAAKAAEVAEAWDDYFLVLDAALSAGPQGEPWSVDVVQLGIDRYTAAGGLACLTI